MLAGRRLSGILGGRATTTAAAAASECAQALDYEASPRIGAKGKWVSVRAAFGEARDRGGDGGGSGGSYRQSTSAYAQRAVAIVYTRQLLQQRSPHVRARARQPFLRPLMRRRRSLVSRPPACPLVGLDTRVFSWRNAKSQAYVLRVALNKIFSSQFWRVVDLKFFVRAQSPTQTIFRPSSSPLAHSTLVAARSLARRRAPRLFVGRDARRALVSSCLYARRCA